MPDPDMGPFDVPLADLDPAEKPKRATSFGAIADRYERYRPGPSIAAVEWILPRPVGTVVDLGAGTGALTRLLVGRAAEVVAVEPDDRMRAVLADSVPGVRVVAGRGESIPLPGEGEGESEIALSVLSCDLYDGDRRLLKRVGHQRLSLRGRRRQLGLAAQQGDGMDISVRVAPECRGGEVARPDVGAHRLAEFTHIAI